jgi:hypothetical protein
MKSITRASFLTLLGAAGLAVLSPARPRAEGAGQAPPEAMLKGILQAVKDGSYDDFLSRADSDVRAGISRQMFEGVSGLFAPRLQKGHKTTYLTRLRQRGQVIHLWKLEFNDGKDEVLVRLALDKDDPSKYSGILLQ